MDYRLRSHGPYSVPSTDLLVPGGLKTLTNTEPSRRPGLNRFRYMKETDITPVHSLKSLYLRLSNLT